MVERMEQVKEWLAEHKKQAACISAVAVLGIAALVGTTVIYGNQTEEKFNVEAHNKANTDYKATNIKQNSKKSDNVAAKSEAKKDTKASDTKKTAEISNDKKEQESTAVNPAGETNNSAGQTAVPTGESAPAPAAEVTATAEPVPVSEPTYTPVTQEPSPSPEPAPAPEPAYAEAPSAPTGGEVEVDSHYQGENVYGGVDYGGGYEGDLYDILGVE